MCIIGEEDVKTEEGRDSDGATYLPLSGEVAISGGNTQKEAIVSLEGGRVL